MSDYTNSFGAATKDATQATIAAADIGAQLDLIATAVATKSNKVIPAAISNIAVLSSSGDLQDGGALVSSLFTVADWTIYGNFASIIPASDTHYTLSASEAKYGTLKISTGSWTTNWNVIVPITSVKTYWVVNNSAYTATVKTPSGTGIAVLSGTSRVVYCDGTNVIDPISSVVQASSKASSSDVITGSNNTLYITPLAANTSLKIQSSSSTNLSGTSTDITGIPAGVKRVVFNYTAMSTNGTSAPQVQLIDSAAVTTGYLGSTADIAAATAGASTFTSGVVLQRGATLATDIRVGSVTIERIGTTNQFMCKFMSTHSDAPFVSMGTYSITLGSELTGVRLTTIGGTDTFDGGACSAIWEY